MPRVFMVQYPRRRDISTAGLEAFGPIIELLPDDARRPPVFEGSAFVKHVIQRLAAEHYNPAEDYFVVVGSVIGLVLGLIGAISAVDYKLRLLVYNAAANAYSEITLDLDHLEDAYIDAAAAVH